MPKYLQLNLQFFAEGEGGGESEGQQSEQGGITQKGNSFDYTDPAEVPEYEGGIEPFPWEHEPHSNLSNELDNVQTQQQPEESNQESNQSEQTEPANEPSEFDFGGRKVKPNDPDSLKGLQDDFKNAQRTITQLQQQTQQYENILNNLHQMGINPNNPNQQQGQPSLNANERFNNQQQNFQQQNMQQQNMQQNQQQQFQMPSKERMDELHNQYMDKQYENKFEADLWWEQQPEVQALRAQQTQQVVNPMLEPIQRERETQQRLQDMQTKYNDFDQYVPKMQEILDQRPDLNAVENIENVYWIAKAQALESQPSLEDRLKDPEFRKQLAQDETFRNEVLSNYQSQKQQNNRQAPPMIGARPGGKTPTYQYKAPRNIREAGKLVRKNIRFQ